MVKVIVVYLALFFYILLIPLWGLIGLLNWIHESYFSFLDWNLDG